MGTNLSVTRCCGSSEDSNTVNTQAMAKDHYYERNNNIDSIANSKHNVDNISYSSLKDVPTPRIGSHLTAEPSLEAWLSGTEDEEWQTDGERGDTPSKKVKGEQRKSALITKISYHSMRSLDQTETDMLEEMENLRSLTALRALSKDSNYSIASNASNTSQSSSTPSPAYYDNH